MPHARIRLAVILLFLTSGAAGVAYEVVWARLLPRMLGQTATGHAMVLAAFMGGLGLGYAWLGRRADRVARPLSFYAGLEAFIALWALASPWLAQLAEVHLTRALVAARLDPEASPWVLGPAALALVLPPTVAMGGTLPALARWLAPDPHDAGIGVARLYAWNSAGGVVGALGAGVGLVPLLGVKATVAWVAGVNLMVAALAAWLDTAKGPAVTGTDATAADTASSDTAAAAAALAVASAGAHESLAKAPRVQGLVAAAFLSGFLSLGLQTLWIRYAGVTLGSSVWSFSVVVALCIGAVALGSAALRVWLSRRPGTRPRVRLGVAWLGTAVALAVSVPAWERLPWLAARMRHALANQPWGFEVFVVGEALLLAVLIVPATAFLATVLPLTAGVAARRVGRTASGTAAVFASNTAGCVLGAATGATLWLPAFGLDGLLRGAIALPALAGAAVLSRERGRRWAAILGAALALAVMLAPAPWDARVLSSGAFRDHRAPPADFAEYRRRVTQEKLVYLRDDPDATVAVLERDGHRVLRLNGKPDASTRGDMVTQVTSGHLPLLLARNRTRTLVIGFGSGVTAGSAALHGGEVDTIEISQAVLDAGSWFGGVNGQVLHNPRVHVHRADARAWLAASPHRYDAILSEPSNPWVAGNAALFSTEFFQLARDRLAPGGVLAQWFHAYEMDDATWTNLIRTVGGVFPHVTLWELFPDDLLLVASMAPHDQAPQTVADRLQEPRIRTDLDRVGLGSPWRVLSLQVAGPATIRRLADSPGDVQRDDRPMLEFTAPRLLFLAARAGLTDRIDARVVPVGRGERMVDRWQPSHPPSPAEVEQLFVWHSRFPGAPAALRRPWIPTFLAHSTLEFLTDLALTIARLPWESERRQVADRLETLGPDNARALYAAARLLTGLDDARAHRLALRCLRLGDEPQGRCRGFASGVGR